VLATGGANGRVQLFDTRNGSLFRQLDGDAGAVLAITFSNDSLRLAAGYADNTVKIWKTTSVGEPIILRAHTAPVQALAFSDDGKRLATGSWDASVKIWDVDISHWEMNVEMWNRTRNRQELLTLQEQGQEDAILSVSFSPDGKTLAAARANNTIKLW
jgi:WD40 repeat protein